MLNPISSLARTAEFRAFLRWLWIPLTHTTVNLASVKLMFIIKRPLEMKSQDILVSNSKNRSRKISTATMTLGSIMITNSNFLTEINMPMSNRISTHLESLSRSSSPVYMLLQKSHWLPYLEQTSARGKRLEVPSETLWTTGLELEHKPEIRAEVVSLPKKPASTSKANQINKSPSTRPSCLFKGILWLDPSTGQKVSLRSLGCKDTTGWCRRTRATGKSTA